MSNEAIAQPTLVIELIADEEQGGFTARLPDIPVYGEGETEEQAIADLQEGLKGYIETFGLGDALNRVVSPTLKTGTLRSILRDVDLSPAEFERLWNQS